MNPQETVRAYHNWLVVGVSADRDKYSTRIYERLKQLGKQVYGVNPRPFELDDEPIYPSIDAVNEPVDVIVYVVNPTIGLNLLDDVVASQAKILWLQPGTRSPELIAQAKAHNLQVIEDCVLVASEAGL